MSDYSDNRLEEGSVGCAMIIVAIILAFIAGVVVDHNFFKCG